MILFVEDEAEGRNICTAHVRAATAISGLCSRTWTRHATSSRER
jgi:hypothetical protein